MIPKLNSDSSTGLIYKGSSARFQGVLLRDGSPRNITGTVTARLAKPGSSDAIGDEIEVTDSDNGFAIGKVVVVIPAATTALIDVGEVRLFVFEHDGANVWPYPFEMRAVEAPAP